MANKPTLPRLRLKPLLCYFFMETKNGKNTNTAGGG